MTNPILAANRPQTNTTQIQSAEVIRTHGCTVDRGGSSVTGDVDARCAHFFCGLNYRLN